MLETGGIGAPGGRTDPWPEGAGPPLLGTALMCVPGAPATVACVGGTSGAVWPWPHPAAARSSAKAPIPLIVPLADIDCLRCSIRVANTTFLH